MTTQAAGPLQVSLTLNISRGKEGNTYKNLESVAAVPVAEEESTGEAVCPW